MLDACRGMKEIIVPDPLDPDPQPVTVIQPATSLKTFAEDLRRDLREPWVEQHWVEQHWVEHALGAGVVEPIEDPNTGQLFEPLKKRK